MGYIEAEAQAWARVVEALREYLQVQAEYCDVRDWRALIDVEIVDAVRSVMLDDLLPEAMQDARGMQYTGDNQPEGSNA